MVFKKGNIPWNKNRKVSTKTWKDYKYSKNNKCINCGKRITNNAKICLVCLSISQRLENSSRWKGGRTINFQGYVLIKCPSHPFCDKQGYVKEHRLIMEKKIKRYLNPKEIVHHKNRVRNDNRIKNLQLFKNSSKHLQFEFKGKKSHFWKGGISYDKNKYYLLNRNKILKQKKKRYLINREKILKRRREIYKEKRGI